MRLSCVSQAFFRVSMSVVSAFHRSREKADEAEKNPWTIWS